ncbi:MAG: hypothetical protein LBF86_06135 [Helicobacteraceae bacterium]|jgi:hypothetical protein|nr:hypothetical protein [Helicobacteraceae bacterium]
MSQTQLGGIQTLRSVRVSRLYQTLRGHYLIAPCYVYHVILSLRRLCSLAVKTLYGLHISEVSNANTFIDNYITYGEGDDYLESGASTDC